MSNGEHGHGSDPVDTRHVVRRVDAAVETVERVEGRAMTSPAIVRVLAETDEMLLVETEMPGGEGSPPHRHDHESVGYVVSGRVEMTVDGVAHELDEGDGFIHPEGAEHSMAAVDGDAVWVEVKHPPTRTW